jgi:hypothetical protein
LSDTLSGFQLIGNPGQGHLSAKYEQKNTRDIAFRQRKIDICAVRYFQQAETRMEKDKPFNTMFRA